MSGASNPLSLRLISDFNLDQLKGHLANAPETAGIPTLQVSCAPFGQVQQSFAAESLSGVDAALVWTRPEGVLPSFRRVLDFEPVSTEEILAEVDQWAAALREYRKKVRYLLLASWTPPVSSRGFGILDWRREMGHAHLLARINLHLADQLADDGEIFILDAQRWLQRAGNRAGSEKMWYAAKIPFGGPVFAEAAQDVRAALAAVRGLTRKLLVLDLDDTLWGGTVGESGWAGVRLGGHQIEGEAFVAFQQALKGLSRRGIQLAIASKNDSATALEVLENHPEMVLKKADFAAWRINWQDKAQNIADLTAELNLGLSSVVFIDDNERERARVREALPEVLVPEWPADPTLYLEALRQLRCFDLPALSGEDRRRTEMYQADQARRAACRPDQSGEEWLASLQVSLQAEKLSEANLPRAAQLLNKTNQMNLSTRRLSAGELQDWAAGEGREFWTIRVSDRFGDQGLSGLLGLQSAGEVTLITDFVLSCRVMGRGIEKTLLYLAIEAAKRRGSRRVEARYLPTPRNGPCLDFWKNSGFASPAPELFTWELQHPWPMTEHIQLILTEN